MFKNFVKAVVFLIQIVISYSQKTAYNETCNSTEECADHRYQCIVDEENVLRCLCDRYHSWFESIGCVQIYNASEIMKMTVTVTDNIRHLEEEVDQIMQAQIAAGLFIFGMVIVATLTVSAFCIYVHIKDRRVCLITPNHKHRDNQISFQSSKPSTSTSVV